MKIECDISGVNVADSLGAKVNLCGTDSWGRRVEFEYFVPNSRLKNYQVGRRVDVEVKLKPEKKNGR